MQKKFTDKQFLYFYNKGCYDIEIAYHLKVNVTSITRRRWKLNLITNYTIHKNTVTNPRQHLLTKNAEYYKTSGKQRRQQPKYMEQHRQNARRYRQRHPEKVRTSKQKYYQKHRKEILAKQRKN